MLTKIAMQFSWILRRVNIRLVTQKAVDVVSRESTAHYSTKDVMSQTDLFPAIASGDKAVQGLERSAVSICGEFIAENGNYVRCGGQLLAVI